MFFILPLSLSLLSSSRETVFFPRRLRRNALALTFFFCLSDFSSLSLHLSPRARVVFAMPRKIWAGGTLLQVRGSLIVNERS